MYPCGVICRAATAAGERCCGSGGEGRITHLTRSASHGAGQVAMGDGAVAWSAQWRKSPHRGCPQNRLEDPLHGVRHPGEPRMLGMDEWHGVANAPPRRTPGRGSLRTRHVRADLGASSKREHRLRQDPQSRTKLLHVAKRIARVDLVPITRGALPRPPHDSGPSSSGMLGQTRCPAG